jgi:pimeloyl-ACP methyl ester carboxylesterase
VLKREVRTVDLGPGRSLHAVSAGEGSDIVLLHGALNTSADWLAGPFDEIAAAGFRVAAIDRPGCGRSRRPRFAGAPRDQAKQIRAGLEAMGIERPLIVAHSFADLWRSLTPSCSRMRSATSSLRAARIPGAAPARAQFPDARAAPLFGPLLSSAAEATIDLPMLKLFQKLMFSPQEVPGDWEANYPYADLLRPERWWRRARMRQRCSLSLRQG